MSWLEKPAVALSVTIRIIMLNPDAVADQPSALCKYIGRNMLRARIEPQPNECPAIANRAVGSASTATGMSGSRAVRSLRINPPPSTSADAISARTGGENHG